MTAIDTTSTQRIAIGGYSTAALRLVALCFVLSGATGLIYEVLWARMLGLVFGATTVAISTVLAAFMGGLAIGSALAGKIGAKIARPIRAYGILEIGIAIYALAVPFIFALVDDFYFVLWNKFSPSFFVFSLLRFFLSGLLLLIPTTLMGATLPVLSAALLRSQKTTTTSITKFYTRNLVGAICGTIAAGFFLLPTLGVRRTIYVASVINICIGIAAIIAEWRFGTLAEPSGPRATNESVRSDEAFEIDQPKFWLFCAFVSGFVTFSTQVAWTRVLTMIVGSSTYAFSITIALFLLSLSLGAYVVARLPLRVNPRRVLMTFELVTAFSLVLSILVINKMPSLLIAMGLKLNISTWLGLLALQLALITLLIPLPAFLMGATMPLVLRWADGHGQRSIQLVGLSYAVNTVGAIAGALIAGFVLIPKTSTRFTIMFAVTLCLVVAGMAYEPKPGSRDRDVRKALAAGATISLILLAFLVSPRMDLAYLSVGAYDSLVRVLAKTRGATADSASERKERGEHKLLFYEEGPTATVTVRKDWDVISMAINGRTNASDREDMPNQVMLGQLPLLLSPRAKRALIVGFASGISVGSMLQSPIESVECVELEPATVGASRFFEHVNNRPLNDPRLNLIIDDARSYLRVTSNRYDVIVSEPSHPWVPGVANLFTKEFFALGRDRLNENGLFVQWVQIYQLSTDSLRSVLATFQHVFPHVLVFRVEGVNKGKDLLLVGSKKPRTLDQLSLGFNDARMSAELARVNIKSEADVRAWFVCDESRLAPAVSGAIINTDDNMHIEMTAPKEAFRPLLQSNAAWVESLVGR
ncbi:MAG TPA: fused MFS/spermidine synthase [Pyrinomonadaceae bacterium]|nr:fused MFS/spermidine synthase [Pyrinomonadaceae bacterium]